MSQAGLKALGGTSGSTPPSDEAEKESQLEICPQCSTKYDKREDVRLLNPDPETEALMRVAMELRQEKSKSKKSKKRKVAETTDNRGASPAAAEGQNVKLKKPKTTSAPNVNPTIAAASRAVASSLAMEEAKRRTNMSDAVKSLYESKDKDKKETFMTRGTFTRVSCSLPPHDNF